jgi:hypothetical protein
MRGYFMILAALILMSAISCGRTDPIATDTAIGVVNRDCMFFQDAVPIFSGDAEHPIVDADNAEVINGPGSNNEGTTWVDGDDYHWGVATAIQTDDLTGDHLVIFRKLGVTDAEEPFIGDDTYLVPFPDFDPYEVTEARLPKVAACYRLDLGRSVC